MTHGEDPMKTKTETVEDLRRRLAAVEKMVRELDDLRVEVGKLKIEVEEMREA